LDNSDSIDKIQDAVNPQGSTEKTGEKIDESVDKTKDAMKQSLAALKGSAPIFPALTPLTSSMFTMT
jgi:hypothetical protein